MTNIVVLIKQVPDTYSERKLTDTFALDRAAADPVLDEINERAVEEALRIKEAGGGEVTVLCVGPDRATDAIRKALSMGADKAVHVNDPGIAGSDAIQTAYIISQALAAIGDYDLVIAGNEATDGRVGAVPAILAEYTGLPHATHLRKLTVEGGALTGERETDEGIFGVSASLPAIVSVNEKINDPRFPSFKGIMAAKKKPVDVRTLADLGIGEGVAGADYAATRVLSSSPKPPKSAGERVVDEGEAGNQVAAYLVGEKII